MTDLQHIIERYVDDPDAVSEAELGELVSALRDEPDLAEEVKEQLVVSELLGQRLALDRGDFVAQVQQRIRDLETGMTGAIDSAQDLIDRVADLDPRISRSVVWRARPKRPTRRARPLLAASVLVAAGVGIWYFRSPHWHNVASVHSCQGTVIVMRDGARLQAMRQLSVRPADRVSTGDDGSVRFAYRDGTTIRLGGDTAVGLVTDRPTGGKRVEIEYGSLEASIAEQGRRRPMVFGSPMAEARVLGTRLSLSVEQALTYVEVTDGRVELARKGGTASVVVQAGDSGVATPEGVDTMPTRWPIRDDALAFLFDGKGKLTLTRDVATGGKRTIGLTRSGAARLDPDGAMVVAEGGFVARDAASAVALACRQTNEMTIEAMLRCARRDQPGPAPIIASSDFTLYQNGDGIILRLNGQDFALCQIADPGLHHIAVGCRPGQLVCYLDGRRVLERADVRGDLRSWHAQDLIFGRGSQTETAWHGTVTRVAIYGRCLDAYEAKVNDMLCRRQELP